MCLLLVYNDFEPVYITFGCRLQQNKMNESPEGLELSANALQS